MTDPIDRMSKHLKNAPTPEINKDAENNAIEKALAAFDKKNTLKPQGFHPWRRLMETAQVVLHPRDGAFMKKNHIVAGGACAATLVVALLGTSIYNRQFLRPDAKPAEVAALEKKAGAASAVPEATAKPRDIIVAQASNPPPENAGLAQRRPSSVEDLKGEVNLPALDSPEPPVSALIERGRTGVANRVSHIRIAPDGDQSTLLPQAQTGDTFEHAADNPLKLTKDEPVSTFSIDVDTASYSFLRASLNSSVLPPKDAVRIEEMINYFPYDYALPKDKTAPFAVHVGVMPTPWNTNTKLVHIGIKGYEMPKGVKPHSNLVFLVDTSGSMNEPNKLPLLKNSLKLLLDSLQPDDTVAIVTYAGSAGIVLEPTRVASRGKILGALEDLNSGGSTAGAAGIEEAYALAESNFDKAGVNRVILATDGDFNVGISDPAQLQDLISKKRQSGVFLSVLGFGSGNYNDQTMQALAQNGNGNAAYIDTLSEARKVLVEEAGSTLFTIAKDVKIQVEFNPAKVAEYRLIGYETRMLKREDFNNDKIDAGEIGAGHAVTALYEITPAGSPARAVDDLRYGTPKSSAPSQNRAETSDEYGFVKIRYKLPNEDESRLITTPINAQEEVASLAKASDDARFAASVAAFGQILRGEDRTQTFSYDDVLRLATSAKGEDTYGYRAEFINLVRLAKAMAGSASQKSGQVHH